jgi:hypothetical protein
MNLSDVRQSKFLKKEDVGAGKLVTIQSVAQENVAVEGADPEMKVTLHFAELDKPLVLNSTNGQIIAKIVGSETDIERTWVGTQVVLYNDPNVSYAGKLVGGIRVRAPKPGAVKPKPAQTPVRSYTPPVDDAPHPADAGDDGLPF